MSKWICSYGCENVTEPDECAYCCGKNMEKASEEKHSCGCCCSC